MKAYLVGGAVRDELLGRPVTERDWVVVGSSPKEMLRQGFRQVGSDFPVFLHPQSGEQYALARTERKTGAGHRRFAWRATDVPLEDDLARRDLTINAIAKDAHGLIDPWGGQADIEARVLRHVSPAFAEDPLRVFRVARFAAQLPGFTIHPATLELMQRMAPELAALSGERVWAELVKAAPRLGRFFEVVQELKGAHWFAALDLAATVGLFAGRDFDAARTDSARTALAAVGWANTSPAVASTYAKLKAPAAMQRAVKAVATHGRVLASRDLPADALYSALAAIGAFRQGPVPALVLDAVAACSGVDGAPLRRLVEELRGLRVAAEPGPAYGAALKAHRLEHIESWLKRGAAATSSANAP